MLNISNLCKVSSKKEPQTISLSEMSSMLIAIERTSNRADIKTQVRSVVYAIRLRVLNNRCSDVCVCVSVCIKSAIAYSKHLIHLRSIALK